MNKLLLFLIIFLFYSFHSILSMDVSLEKLPGLKTTMYQKGLDYAKEIAVQILRKEISKVQIPNQEGNVGTPIGTVDYWITELKLTHINFPTPAIQFHNNGVLLAIQNTNAGLTFKWRFKKRSFPKIGDSGSGTVSVSDVKCSVDVAVTVTNEGKLQIQIRSAGFNIGNMSLKLSGGASWLYQIFINLFKGSIKGEIEKAVRQALINIVAKELNDIIARLPTRILIPDSNGVGIDYSFSANPRFTPQFMSVMSNGEFFIWNRGPGSLLPRPPTPDNMYQDRMAEFILSDFVANTAGEAFHQSGKLQLEVRDSQIPSWSPVRLNTSSFSLILPQLPKKYPNMEIVLRLKTSQNPSVNITTNGIRAVAIGDIEWNVINQGKLENAFTLESIITCAGRVGLEGKTITGNLQLATIKNKLKNTNIGDFSVELFDALINLLIEKGVLPALNEILKKGFPLPSIEELELVNPSIHLGNGFVSIASDVKYTKPIW